MTHPLNNLVLRVEAGVDQGTFHATTTKGVTVTIKDSFGNVVPSYTGTVTFSSSDTQAVLPSPYTYTSTDAGSHTFPVTLKTAGTQTITATDSTNGLSGSQTVTITAATAGALVVSGFPAPVAAGSAQSFTVKATDSFGNVATSYVGTVHFTSSDGKAVLPADYTFVAADAGVHTFSATLKTSGPQSITATDTAASTITGSQGGITVTAGAASAMTVGGYPSPTPAGP